MAIIDALLARLRASGASRVFLQGNSPVQLELPGGTSQGATLANERIEEILREIAPADVAATLDELGQANFVYSTAEGSYRVAASRNNGIISLDVEPMAHPVTFEKPAPAVPPAAAVAPAAVPSPAVPGPAIESTAPPAYGVPAPPPSSPLDAPAPFSPNNSGQKDAVVPPEVRGFNWGGLFLGWIWAIGNNTWIGLLGLIPCVGFIMRIVLGVKGNEWAWRNKQWKSVQHFRTAQMVWGIVGACLFFMSFPIYAAIMFPVFGRSRENARRASCQSHLKVIMLGVKQYNGDHADKFPTGTTLASWQAAIKPYILDDKLFLCPSAKGGEESYILNPNVAGLEDSNLANPNMVPVIADADGERHLQGVNVAFADGHIKWYQYSVFKSEILPAMNSAPEMIR